MTELNDRDLSPKLARARMAGGAQFSAIHVARMAGMPKSLVAVPMRYLPN